MPVEVRVIAGQQDSMVDVISTVIVNTTRVEVPPGCAEGDRDRGHLDNLPEASALVNLVGVKDGFDLVGSSDLVALTTPNSIVGIG